MSILDSPPIPTVAEDRKLVAKTVLKIAAALIVFGITIALVISTATGRSQQNTIDRNNQATLCRAQINNNTAGVIDLALVKLLEDPSTDGQIAILDLIVASQNRDDPNYSIDYKGIAQVSQAMKSAQLDRKTYTAQVIRAIEEREQAISTCQPKEGQ